MATRKLPETDPEKLRNQYPSNSYTTKQPVKTTETDIPPTTKQQPAVRGKVRKQGLLRKFTRYIVEDTIESAKERTLADIVIPGIKTLIFDTATEILDQMLFGATGDRPRSSRGRTGYSRNTQTSYSSYYNSRGRVDGRDEPRRALSYEPDDIIMDTRQDAQVVLEDLDHVIQEYGQASIADLYDIIGQTAMFTDYKYGWDSLRDAGIKPVREGFLLILPRTKPIEK